jgi:hypothetical protein
MTQSLRSAVTARFADTLERPLGGPKWPKRALNSLLANLPVSFGLPRKRPLSAISGRWGLGQTYRLGDAANVSVVAWHDLPSSRSIRKDLLPD